MATNKRLIKSNDEGGGGASFNTVTYTGDAGNTGNTLSKTVTGVGFQPDFVWGKNRDYAGSSHILFDSVRSPEKWLSSNNTTVEYDTIYSQSTILPDGFTTGTGDGLNKPNDGFVAWCWKAGGAAVTNTDGTITSQVSANTEAGFSIVSYTGNNLDATIGHGLGSAPEMIIVKNRDNSDATFNGRWFVYHSALGNRSALFLNLTDAAIANNSYPWNSTSPTSTVFSVDSNVASLDLSILGNNYIAYCFAEVAGFSKFGSYTGNGNAAGPTINCGFEPAFVMIKASSNIGLWAMHDNKRGNYNNGDIYARLSAEDSAAEYDGYPTDKYVEFSATGFQVTNASNSWNGSGRTYIYMAFANQF